MCGIVAQIAKKNKKINRLTVSKMSKSIHHRGPDDEGYFFNDWVGFGFRRLSIIDLTSAANQPMQSESGRYVIVFNGEIYNYVELKKELEKEGVFFKSTSDTEVLLKSYIHWQESCLNKFIGMFAFIIVDLEKEKLFIARDFPGIKPLYYTEDNDYIYFASELKAFKGIVPFVLNQECLYEQFNYRYLAGDRTLVKNVFKVLPGYYWQIYKNPLSYIKKKSYDYQSTFNLEHKKNQNFQSIVATISDKLKDSFLLHTRSDVGFCAQLSGGVDSSYMTAILSSEKKDLKTFSVSLNEQEYDESVYQREVVKRYSLNHYDFKMNERDYAENLERATYFMDTPIVHSGCVLLMKLCKEISNSTKVVLTGEGADELFGGYAHHELSRTYNYLYKLNRKGIRLSILPDFGKFKTIKCLLSEDLILNATKYQLNDLFYKYLKIEKDKMDNRRQYVVKQARSFVSAMLLYDQNTYLSTLLERQDRISMANSIEARVPFCHQKLYELVNPITDRVKFQGGIHKAILKKCAEPYLSKQLIYKKKNGLRLPLHDWYRNQKHTGQYLELLTDDTAKSRGIYNIPNLLSMIDSYRRGDNFFTKPIVTLVNFEIWCRQFV